MRHHNTVKKFGRVSRQRIALMRSLARSLIVHERIETTEARAKALRPFVERLITQGKQDTLARRRLVVSRLGGKREAAKVFETLAPKYKERNGGYLRITKIDDYKTDNRSTAIVEFV